MQITMENPDKVLDRPETTQSSANSPLGNGGPRRPGNIWTAEAREDMFRRREAGEDWETICLDYPRRSRHALQQQYSMMKKQIAVANGTWVTNRRGRKRKPSTGDRWTPVNKQGPRWDEDEEDEDETEDDDFEEAELDEPDYVEATQAYSRRTTTVDGTPTLRPPLPVRSATDPVPRAPKSKIVTFPNKPNSARSQLPDRSPYPTLLEAPKVSIDTENSQWDPDTSTYPHKRRKYSPDSTGNTAASISASSSTPLILPDIMFDEVDFLEILERGRRKAYVATSNYAAEKLSEKRMFDISISKANRRAHDAQEKLQNAYHESAEAAKFEVLQHASEIESLKQDLEKELKLRDELYTTDLDKLQKTIHGLQSERERNDQIHRQEIAGLQKELLLAKESTKVADNTEDLREQNQRVIAELEERAAASKEDLRLRDEARERFRYRIREILDTQIIAHHPKITPQSIAYHPMSKTVAEFRRLSDLLKQLQNGLEDLSVKAIAKAVDNIVTVNEEVDGWLDLTVQSQKSVEEALEAFDKGSIVVHNHPLTNGNGNHDMSKACGWIYSPG